jgi:hypothetical protein
MDITRYKMTGMSLKKSHSTIYESNLLSIHIHLELQEQRVFPKRGIAHPCLDATNFSSVENRTDKGG